MKKLKLCSSCGGSPKLKNVGCDKQFYIYVCSKCGATSVRLNEAALTKCGAKKIWNRRTM